MPRVRAEVSHERCMGVAMCIQVARSAFKLNDAGLAEYRPDGEPDEEELEDAVDACPMGAIKIVMLDDERDPG